MFIIIFFFNFFTIKSWNLCGFSENDMINSRGAIIMSNKLNSINDLYPSNYSSHIYSYGESVDLLCVNGESVYQTTFNAV